MENLTAPSAPVSNTEPTSQNSQNHVSGSNQQNDRGAPSSNSNGATAKSVTQGFENKQSQPHEKTETEYFDVKVNGKSVRMSKNEVLNYASMSHAANSKFEEAAKLRKSVDKIISTAKDNPIQALMDPALGLTKEQIRVAVEQWYHDEYVVNEALSPDQKRAKELEAKLKTYEQAEQEKIRQQQEAEELELTNKQREYLQNQIIEALDRSGLPKTKLIASRMAFYMRQNMANGWEAPIDLIVKQVRNERQSLMQGEVGGLEGQDLIDYLGGDEVVNKIRKYDLQRLREQRASKTPAFSAPSQGGRDGYGNGEKISSSEVNRRLRELRSGKKLF